jgi:hypothetical protein
MKLTDLAKKILKEDTWGNNPSAGAPQNPGKAPTAAPASGETFYNVGQDFRLFVGNIEKTEAAEEKKLDEKISQKILNKNITAKASKGSVGQMEKEYTFVVASVDVNFLKDQFYIILKDKDETDYYINTNFQIKVNPSNTPEPEKQEAPQSKLKSVGGVIPNKPLSAGNPFPQK